MFVMIFNFLGSVYLFFIAFRMSQQIKQRNRDVEFKSLLRNENGATSSSDDIENGSVFDADSGSLDEDYHRGNSVKVT